jgi:phosphohistidine phosphatase SixA
MSIFNVCRSNKSDSEEMTRHLYLLRHAKAEPWNPLGNDFSRPLSQKGMLHAKFVSEWFIKNLNQPDAVLCSPAKRTRETLAPLLSRWPQLLANTDYVDSMYGASLNMLLTLAEDAFSYSKQVLMVGHNPAIGSLLIHLLQHEQATRIQGMAPGTLAVIGCDDGFKRDAQAGSLLHLVEEKIFQSIEDR